MHTISQQRRGLYQGTPRLFRTRVVPEKGSATTRWSSRRASTNKGRLEAPGLRPEPWNSSPQQEQALAALRTRLTRMASGSMCADDETLRWYLRDRYFDVDEAEAKLLRMLRWKQAFHVAREYASGKAYIHEHVDVYGRPAIVTRASRHVTGEYPIEGSKRLLVHLIDKAISQLESEGDLSAGGSSSSSVGSLYGGGGGEQLVGIFDLRGFSVTRNADFAFAAFMIEAFFEYYPRRVGQVLLVEAPWVFGPAWEVIRPLMRKYAALVRFISVKEIREEFFTPSTVPPDFRS